MVQEELHEQEEEFLAISRSETIYRLLAISALLYALLGLVPEWLDATGVSVSIIALLTTPESKDSHIEGASVAMLFAHDLGLDATLLAELQRQDHIFAARGGAEFTASRILLAEAVKANVWKSGTSQAVLESMIVEVRGTELTRRLKELLDLVNFEITVTVFRAILDELINASR